MEWCPTAVAPQLGGHLQFYAVAKKKVTITGFKALLGDSWSSCHLEVCTDTQRSLQCVEEYCNDPYKDSADDHSDLYRFGVFPTGNAGAQTLDDLRKQLVAGASLKRLIEDGGAELELLSKHQRFIETCQKIFGEKRDPKVAPRIWILTGPSGTGKSFWWKQKFGEGPNVYRWSLNSGGNSTWVTDLAIGAKVWVIEEFSGQVQPDLIKEICDYGTPQVQSKGNYVNCCATDIVITSNFEVEEWWGKLKAERPEAWERHMTAIRRRFQEFETKVDYRQTLRNFRLQQRLEAAGGVQVTFDQQQQTGPAAPAPLR